jgi:hypothetical protein
VIPPGLRWLGRWGISIGSLGVGLAVLFVFRRGLPHVGWIVGYLVLLWLLVVVLTELRTPLEERRQRLVIGAAEYTIQTLQHNLLLFVLPAYYASATLGSANVLFPAGVALGALVTAVDPWYRLMVLLRPWANHLLLGWCMFVGLNVALPLVGVPPILALTGSGAMAALALVPALRRHARAGWPTAAFRAAGAAVLVVTLVWIGRAAVPPAPLFLARAVAARDVMELEPVEEVHGAIAAPTLGEWGGLVAYTAVYAPAGLRQPIEHVWWRNGEVVARIPLSPVHGGRKEGFRTYSRRTEWPPPVAGRYTVDVMTGSGQLIGRLRFQVTS